MDFSLDLNVHCVAQNSENLVVERREEGSVAPVTMNAFELISKSQGLNLSSLFEKQMVHVDLIRKMNCILLFVVVSLVS